MDLFHLFQQAIDGQVKVTRHRLDLVSYPRSRHDEERIDQMVDGEMGFTDHATQMLLFSDATRTIDRVPHVRSSLRTVLSAEA